jgi:DNA-binding NarL/FixJ family response regulator
MRAHKKKPWTEDEICDLIRLYRIGIPIEQIANKYEVTVNAIQQQLFYRNEMGKRKKLVKPFKYWTPEELDSLLYYAEQGFPLRSIAYRLNRSISAVTLKLHHWKKNVLKTL